MAFIRIGLQVKKLCWIIDIHVVFVLAIPQHKDGIACPNGMIFAKDSAILVGRIGNLPQRLAGQIGIFRQRIDANSV